MSFYDSESIKKIYISIWNLVQVSELDELIEHSK